MLHVTNVACHTIDVNAEEIKPIKQLIGRLGLRYIYSGRKNIPAAIEELNGSMYRYARVLRLRAHFGDAEYIYNPFRVPNPGFDTETLINETQALCETFKDVVNDAGMLSKGKLRPNLNNNTITQLTTFKKKNMYVVRNADKNMGPTIMSRNWYNKEVKRQLSDTTTYTLVPEVPRFWEELQELLDTTPNQWPGPFVKPAKEINALAFLKVMNEFKPAKFYIIPKLHKSPVVGRPIVAAATNSNMTRNASVVVAYILEPLLRFAPQVIRSNIVCDIEMLPPEVVHVSLDFSSLYTNLKLDYVLKAVTHFMNMDPAISESVKSLLSYLITYICNNNYFTDGIEEQDEDGHTHTGLYRQIKGLAMGTPCAPVLANLTLAYIEASMIRNDILLYKRYIDDILITCKNADAANDYVKYIVEEFAVYQLELNITMFGTSVDFLDLHVCRNTVRLHRKHLNVYSYLNFNSYHPITCKKGFISGECIRIIRNSSSFEDYVADLKYFIAALKARGYPTQVIRDATMKIKYADRSKYLSMVQTEAPRDEHKTVKARSVFVCTHNLSTAALDPRTCLTLTMKAPNITNLPNLPKSIPMIAFKNHKVTIQTLLG